jgi:hypothetical protein
MLQAAGVKDARRYEAWCWAAGVTAWVAISVAVILSILWLLM